MTILLPRQVAHLASVTYRPLKAHLLNPGLVSTVTNCTRILEVFLVLNHHEIEVDIDEQEHIILSIASGQLNRPDFEQWLRQHTKMIRQC
jgi:hypothetical protein